VGVADGVSAVCCRPDVRLARRPPPAQAPGDGFWPAVRSCRDAWGFTFVLNGHTGEGRPPGRGSYMAAWDACRSGPASSASSFQIGRVPEGAGSVSVPAPPLLRGAVGTLSRVWRRRHLRHRPAGRCCRSSGLARWGGGDPHSPGPGRATGWPPSGRACSRARSPPRGRRGDPFHRLARAAAGVV